MNDVCGVLNRYAIPRLIGLNSFPGITGFPKFKVSSVVAPDLTELGNFISKLAGAKMPLFPDLDLENHIRRAAGLPLTSEDTEARERAISAVEKSTTPKEPKEEEEPASPKEKQPGTKGGEE